MPYYKKKADFHTIEYSCEPLLLFLRQNCPVLKEDDDEEILGVREAFYANKEIMDKLTVLYKNLYGVLRIGGFIETAPHNYSWTEIMVYVLNDKNSYLPTLSPTHIRLPKTQYLLSLTPEDFFAYFRILDSATNTAYGKTFIIKGDTYFPNVIKPFFVTNDKTMRPNPDYCDRIWTQRKDVTFIAEMEPTERNQLYALQYLAARNYEKLLYFPLDTAVELELEWDQINAEYVAPFSTKEEEEMGQ